MSAKQRWAIIIIIITISLKDIATVLMPLLTPHSLPLVSYFPRSGCDRPSLATLGSLYTLSLSSQTQGASSYSDLAIPD